MAINFSKFNSFLVLACLAMSIGLTGCTGVKNSMRIGEKDSLWNPVAKLRAEKEKETPPSEPETMVATWKQTVYESPDSVAVRGFAGRIFFYDQSNNAVPADGDLIIYGYDDSNKDSGTDRADKQFVFRSTEFQTHKSDSGFGVSYSVWLPWEKVGGFRKPITLVPRFKTKEGKIIRAGQAQAILDGRVQEKQLSDNSPYKVLGGSSAVLGQANYDSNPQNGDVAMASFDDPEAKGRIKTSTISLTPNLARRMEMSRPKPKDQNKIAETKKSMPEYEELRRMIESRTKASRNPVEESDSDKPATRRAFGLPGAFN